MRKRTLIAKEEDLGGLTKRERRGRGRGLQRKRKDLEV